MREVDLHPNLVPEAVKLTAVKMIMEQTGRDEPGPDAQRAAAEVIAYCMIGADAFAAANGPARAEKVERRIEAALSHGTSLDARLILLTLHAKVIQPSVIEHFGLETASD
ncbi:MAG: hypothetical protein R3D01_01925 [Hyphomicrobiales bacterium]